MITSRRMKPNTTQTPDLILDNLAAFTNAELRVCLVVIRSTLGWNKESDWLTQSQIVKRAGMSRASISPAIGTLVERTTRFTLLVKLKNKDATSVCQAFSRKLNRLPPEFKKTLTHDQGQEMAEHDLITQKTKIKVYLAHPHAPWERGTNENTNYLVRDFYPKGTNFLKISSRDLKKTQDLLNERPRKVLNWHCPKEVFNQMLR